jgi:hypothetical protein
VKCFPRCLIHCGNIVIFPVLMFHLNEHSDNIWRSRTTFDMVKCNHTTRTQTFYAAQWLINTCMIRACTHFTHSMRKNYTLGTVSCI